MTRITMFLAAAAAIGGVAAPLAAAQYQPAYPQAVPQPYPGQPGYGYSNGYQPGYQPGYAQQGYAQGGIGGIIDTCLETHGAAAGDCPLGALPRLRCIELHHGNRAVCRRRRLDQPDVKVFCSEQAGSPL